ncbi:MAG: hypothetical protein WC912_08750, partial [Thermovirgaceae bacterium]
MDGISIVFDAYPINIEFKPDLPLWSFFSINHHAVSDDTASDWTVYHGSLGQIENITSIHVQDAYLRFARKAEVEIYDPDGSIAAATPRDTSIYLYAAPYPGAPPQLRFGGFVVDIGTSENTTTLDLLSY